MSKEGDTAALLDRGRMWIRSVGIGPPASDDGRPWPCPVCYRFQPLERMRRVQVEQLQDVEMGHELLVCLACIRDTRMR